MRGWIAVLVGSVGTVLAGCGGTMDRQTARVAPGWSGGGTEDVSIEGPAPAAAAPSPPPPAAETEASESRPRERPGLGTEWGEDRESPIRRVSFFREDPGRPFATAELFYDDRRGIEALASWHGGAPRFHDVSAVDGAITVSLRDASGDPLDAMRVGDRTYVAGEEGERYSIVIVNHTAMRFEAVATVDGLDVINGQPGTFDNRGYLVMPHASLEIDGFRQSEEVVAAFRFAKVRDSYAAQRGAARNVGVIGIAFFAEQGDVWSAEELRRRDAASPFPAEPGFAPPPR